MPLPIRHNLAGFPPTISPSSHAVEADGWVYLTGQLGRDLRDPDAPLPEGIEAQAARTLANMRETLEALGLGMVHIVSMRVYLRDLERDYAAMNRVYAAAFAPDARPTRTCVGVAALSRGALVEMECVAKRP